MDEDGEKRYGEVDLISNLPDSLKFEVLLNLPTKEVVKTSVLSSRWRNLWRYVPGLDLDYRDFIEYDTFLSFFDRFFGFNNESRLQKFKLMYDLDNRNVAGLTRWINTIVDRKIQHLDLVERAWYIKVVENPLTLYTCESLVSLKLTGLNLATPKFVSLPSLKVMELIFVSFDDDNLGLETLISGCPVLESLFIHRCFSYEIRLLRVCSQSLLSLTYFASGYENLVEDLVVVIDAPRLEYLSLRAHRIESFELNNLASLVKADIDMVYDHPKRHVIQNFLRGISSVKDLIISSSTLEVIYNYSRCETLPLFRNLSSLRVEFFDYRWEMLPIFLESCPNLKSLVMGSARDPTEEGSSIIYGPRCLLTSLEYVEIERPLKGKAMEMKLVGYLLENSTILKKLTLWLDDSIKKEESVILKEKLLTVSRLSRSCQVVIL